VRLFVRWPILRRAGEPALPNRQSTLLKSIYVSMQVRVIPEQANVFLGNSYFLGERLAGSDVKENIVTLLQRRNIQAVKVQICLH